LQRRNNPCLLKGQRNEGDVERRSLIYCGDAGNENGEVFNYPARGSIVATFTGNFDFPLGVVAAKR
jgi:hypothetical protein